VPGEARPGEPALQSAASTKRGKHMGPRQRLLEPGIHPPRPGRCNDLGLEPHELERLLDYAAAARYLCTTPRHVRELWARRHLAAIKVGRLVRFAREDLDAFINARRVPAVERGDVRLASERLRSAVPGALPPLGRPRSSLVRTPQG
jgi:excisionase family DNA binding protein